MSTPTETPEAPQETRASIKGIMGQDTLTMYDVGRLFRYFSEVAVKMPQAVLRSAEDAKHDASKTVESAKNAIRTVHGYLDEMEKVENAILDRYDAVYRNVTKKRNEISAALEKLPTSYHLGDLEKLIDLSERLAEMPAETFERVLALAEVVR